MPAGVRAYLALIDTVAGDRAFEAVTQAVAAVKAAAQ
jgi:hypothetical protein